MILLALVLIVAVILIGIGGVVTVLAATNDSLSNWSQFFMTAAGTYATIMSAKALVSTVYKLGKTAGGSK